MSYFVGKNCVCLKTSHSAGGFQGFAGLDISPRCDLAAACPSRGGAVGASRQSAEVSRADDDPVAGAELQLGLSSEQAGKAQSAYEIIVSSSAELAAARNGDRWASGVVSSPEFYQYRLRGPPSDSWSGLLLECADVERWRWADGVVGSPEIHGGRFDFRPPVFPTNTSGLVWIWYPESTNPANAARYFRRKFTTDPAKTVAAAQVIVTADNSCDVYVNETPVVSSTNWKVFSVANVTPQVTNGVNVIAVRAFNISDACGLTGKVQLRYSDGTEETVSLDTATKASLTGPAGWTRRVQRHSLGRGEVPRKLRRGSVEHDGRLCGDDHQCFVE